MIINNKNYTLDREVYDMFQDNWKDNINAFKSQNTAIIVNNIENLNEEDIIKFVDETVGRFFNELEDIIIDKRFIQRYYTGLAVNPSIDEFKQNFTVQCNLRPDLSYINIANREV